MSADERDDAPEAQPGGEARGGDLARRLLSRARAAAGSAGSANGSAGRGTRRRPARRDGSEQSWSSARPDERDPERIGDAVRDLIGDRQWGDTLASAGVVARWDEIVGADVAAHCRPTRLEDGELTLVAESTAWATQIRLLSRQLVERIAAEVGPGRVRTVRVHGPTAPDWRHGPRRVIGRGPRDTYG